ncbi:MAG: molybdopterin-synthase adenylyltransferase MoeB [Rhodospirillales bacterium]
MTFTETQIQRYARHIILPEIGGTGQEKLLNARVLVIGAGGLGSPLLLYLAAAGVGTLGVIDDDHVDLSNLQRQILHQTDSIGRAKVDSAADRLQAINPDVRTETHEQRLTAGNALDIIGSYDIVADGSDNFATRFLVNDACFLTRRTLVSAAILRFDGQIATYRAHDGISPCYRCLQPAAPPAGMIPSCSEAGVIGALAGVAGSLQAAEVVKEIIGIGDSLAGRLILYDALGATFRTIRLPKDPDCALCGTTPTITDLSAHDQG